MVSDEMNMEDITPEDLGCMGEKEVDDGVLEETQPVVKKEVLSLATVFEKIPLEKRKKYRKFYDDFFTPEGRDMSFEEFCVEMYLLESPLKMQYDLQEITAQMHDGYAHKAAVDHTMNRMN